MSRPIAYLAQGKLYLQEAENQFREIKSEFGQSIQRQRLQVQRRNAWKDRGIRSMMMSPQAMAQLEQQAEAVIPIAISSLCNSGEGKLFYALEAGEMGALFRFDPKGDREDRLFHNADFQISHLDYTADQDLIACTKTYPTGITNIATLSPNSVRPNDITEGDSIDLAPRWIPNQKALVYQSAGVSRNSEGFVIDRAPFSIEKLDFNQQELSTLAEDPKSDFLGPQIGSDGLLYYIRRPYRSFHRSFNIWQFLKDILLIPVRLAYAIFQFFNFFSQSFTGKPLIAAGTQQKVEPKRMRIWGDWLTLDNLPNEHAEDGDAPPLVPSSWELVRQGTQGVPEVLATSVLAYDLAADGTVAYSNGSGIYLLSPEGERQRVEIARQIEDVRFLEQREQQE
ncbi:hypothetical protein [Roseofilum capinflatum]|uniref:Uncharacterized protein n=1 Tax=Roseofilum capinflatum BLCC-M114 TaxID=3022440 RepID=A0ABT7B0K7_9CYAN|nr:hypothetical protein [Roseofilum capinflatum]MDJ1172674.1 hypothetical protein [Roseofilum capinflatum BLCC-M114]